MDATAWGAVPAVLGAGLVSGLNPCCLPMYPAAVAACGALRQGSVAANVGVGAAFVLGSALATSGLGVVAALAGHALTAVGGVPGYAIAAVPLLFGLHTLGVIRLPLPGGSAPPPAWRGRLGAVGAGASIAALVAPCTTPVLASVLAVAAGSASVVWGGALLFLYGLALGLPVLAVGAASASMVDRLAGARAGVDRVSGVLLIAVGLYLVWVA